MAIRLINLSDPQDHYYLGKWGEALIIHFLQAKGFCMLESNWRRPGYEIDLIMQKNNQLIGVEVKTRSNKNFDFELIKQSQILRLRRALQFYSWKNRIMLTKKLLAACVIINKAYELPRITIIRIL